MHPARVLLTDYSGIRNYRYWIQMYSVLWPSGESNINLEWSWCFHHIPHSMTFYLWKEMINCFRLLKQIVKVRKRIAKSSRNSWRGYRSSAIWSGVKCFSTYPDVRATRDNPVITICLMVTSSEKPEPKHDTAFYLQKKDTLMSLHHLVRIRLEHYILAWPKRRDVWQKWTMPSPDK